MPHRWILVPLAGIGPATSPLPRECSTTEPQGRNSSMSRCRCVEREAGIEPASLAWKAKVLPLNYSRVGIRGRLACPSAPGAGRSSTPTHRYQPITATSSFLRNPTFERTKTGGGGWIRTSVGVSQQIYSLPPLATRAPLRDEPGTIARAGDFHRSTTSPRVPEWPGNGCPARP